MTDYGHYLAMLEEVMLGLSQYNDPGLCFTAQAATGPSKTIALLRQ